MVCVSPALGSSGVVEVSGRREEHVRDLEKGEVPRERHGAAICAEADAHRLIWPLPLTRQKSL
jgi:hypothetical protein